MMTIEEFGRRLRAREVTSVQVTEECLRRIDADNPRLNAFILVMADEARRQAHEADQELAAGTDRGPLHGVPISIKDLLDIRGVPTTAASRVREGHVADRDAPAIAHLRQAGAVFIGKTNLHEFAFGTTNEDSAFGPARNPHDPARSPGGSSGGSAASVAAGMALATIGTDTGGSIRIPAAACGIVGLKPTIGEVSTDGVVPLSRTLDHVGPLARDRRRRVARVSRAARRCPHHAACADAVHGLRLAVPRQYFCDLLDDDVRARSRRRSSACARPARTSTRSRSATPTDIAPVYLHIVLSRCGGVSRAHARDDARALHAAGPAAAGNGPLRPGRGLRARAGRTRRAAARSRCRAGAARRARPADAADCRAADRRRIGHSVGTIDGAGAQRDAAADAALQRDRPPGDLDPCGPTLAGLPCGLQLVGCRHQTDALLKVALACEPQITGVSVPRGGTDGG